MSGCPPQVHVPLLSVHIWDHVVELQPVEYGVCSFSGTRPTNEKPFNLHFLDIDVQDNHETCK